MQFRTGPFLLLAALSIAAIGATPAEAQTTFSKDVAPIFFKHCVSCHRPGEVAPMPLLSYADARPWTRAIKDRVTSRQMPPWFADPSVGSFANDARLTDQEIATISRWVDGGALQGNPADLPKAPVFTEGWQLGEPDFVITLPEIQIPATGGDFFPTPSIPINIPEDRWVRAVEIRPSNREVTHHSVIFSTLGNPMADNGVFDVLGVWAVGTPPTVYGEGQGRWLRKGQTLRTNLHYHPNGTPQTDRTRVGLYFGKGPLQKEVAAALVGNVLFSIPPNTPNYELRAMYVVDQDIDVVSWFPHMHFRGKDMKLTAVFPGGREETMLNVPAYDFNWQLYYLPKERVRLPRGTRLELVAHYDNSTANKRNPDPNASVQFGEASTAEMMFWMYEFTAVNGVSPERTTIESRFDALALSFTKDTALRVSVPFNSGGAPSPLVFHLPRTGDKTATLPRTYLTGQNGRIGAAPIQQLQWNGDAFEFQTGILGMAGGNGQYTVTGSVEADGRVHGEMRRIAGRPQVAGQPQVYEFSGTINR